MSKYARIADPLPGEPTIVGGNSKIGAAANISLLPGASCPKGVPCLKDCYDRKACRLYPPARTVREDNTAAAKRPAQFMRGVGRQLAAAEERGKLPRFFRWHVGGDFPSLSYMRRAIALAAKFPAVKFLAFTKRYDWASRIGDLPPNFSLILSAWPGYAMSNPRGYRIAWMQDGTETRVPDDALECPGLCESCGMCWSLESVGRDVVFHKH